MKKAVAILVTLVVAGVGWSTLQFGAWHAASQAVADCLTIEATAREMLVIGGNNAEYRYRMQEAKACRGVDLDKSEDPAEDDPTEEPTDEETEGEQPEDTSSPEPTTTVTVVPSTEASTDLTDDPTEEPEARQWEYLANRAPIDKSSHNAFGPILGMAIDKSLDDKSMTADEALTELRYRLTVDPMLTAATGAAFHEEDSALELWSYDEVDAKTKLFAEDHHEWDKANSLIESILDKADEVKIVELRGEYTASWAIPGSVPAVRTDLNVWRSGQLALVINGKLFQLRCGFQEYWQEDAPKGTKPLPEPSPGMDRTPEGTPTPKPNPGPLPDATPTPSETPSEEPSHEPTPEPSTTPPEPTEPPTTSPPTSEPPTTPPPSTPPPSLEPKSSDPADYTVEPDAPKATVTESAQATPDPVVTETTGGGGVVDTPTKTPGSESGVTAPGADPAPTEAPTTTQAPATGANTPEPSATTCVPAPGKSSC